MHAFFFHFQTTLSEIGPRFARYDEAFWQRPITKVPRHLQQTITRAYITRRGGARKEEQNTKRSKSNARRLVLNTGCCNESLLAQCKASLNPIHPRTCLPRSGRGNPSPTGGRTPSPRRHCSSIQPAGCTHTNTHNIATWT